MSELLSIYAGPGAQRELAEHGWHPDRFDTIVGASGGAKLLGIAGLDRFLFSDFLMRGEGKLDLIGSSIGSWRHAALAQSDPVAALQRLHQGYIHQQYEDKRPTAEEISRVSLGILDSVLEDNGSAHLCAHPRFNSHIVTARGRGPTASANPGVQGLGQGLAAISNTLSRRALQAWFQRVVFSSANAEGLGFSFSDFGTLHPQLTPDNCRQALHASGSIPFILTGERDITGAPKGQYWDGGIVDYHFDLGDYKSTGLVLYPHFGPKLIPGWFDKFLPWRGNSAEAMERVVVVCPSERYLANLPHGKIPDRRDFPVMSHAERVEYWQHCDTASDALGEAFAAIVDHPDPLHSVQNFS